MPLLKSLLLLFTISTFFKTSSNQIHTDPTILQWFPHIYRAVQSVQCYIVFTGELQVTKLPSIWYKIIDDGKFEVQGKHKVHTIDFGLTSDVPTCTCKDWEAHRIPCKHFFAVFNWFPEWGWEQLPKSYQSSTYLCLDKDAIATYMQCNSDLSNGSPAEPHRISANIEESDEYSEVDGLFHDEDETGDQLLGGNPM